MQLAATSIVPPVVLKDFSALYTQFNRHSGIAAREQVNDLAAEFGVEARNVKVTPALGESLPPKGYVKGQFFGARGAVDAAIAALAELKLG